MPTSAEKTWLATGGAVYVAMDMVDAQGNPLQGVLTVETPAIEGVAYSLLMFDGYPNPCPGHPGAPRIDAGTGTPGHIQMTLDGICDRAVLVVSHTDLNPIGSGSPNLPPDSNNAVLTDWVVSVTDGGDPINLDFETGDLTGWTIFESGDAGVGDPVFEVVSPGLLDTHHAFSFSTTGAPEDGIEQTITRGFECAVLAWAQGSSQTTAALELRTLDGTVLGRTETTFTGSETYPVELQVAGVPLPEVYTIRLVYVDRGLETASILLRSHSFSAYDPSALHSHDSPPSGRSGRWSLCSLRGRDGSRPV